MIKKVETTNEKNQVYELICLEVEEELVYKDQTKPNKEFVLESFSDANEVYFIDVDNDKVKGYVRIHVFNFCDEIWIYGLYVRENYRNTGIAKSLLDESIKFAKINNKKNIKLYAYSNNVAALKLYEQYGFKEIQRLLSKDLENALK